jgi:hypothetical protein
LLQVPFYAGDQIAAAEGMSRDQAQVVELRAFGKEERFLRDSYVIIEAAQKERRPGICAPS